MKFWAWTENLQSHKTLINFLQDSRLFSNDFLLATYISYQAFSSRRLMSKKSQRTSDDLEKGQNNQSTPTGKVKLVIQPGPLMSGGCQQLSLLHPNKPHSLGIWARAAGQFPVPLPLLTWLPVLKILLLAYNHFNCSDLRIS